ncbi:shikimate kinase [Sutterella sp.]|uniref:shikimate kinase n=1 Tax=Sutterella sp. TaxID=1981025 RepID=UPI0026DEBAEB|nr:shikimate kinase [Sutterella sp.]MDO5532211.1 shikimate kinase [Sutterella sp.]
MTDSRPDSGNTVINVNTTGTLGDLRGQIDAIDTELSRLITERLAVADEIGARKRRLGLTVHALHREAELLAKLAAAAPESSREVLLATYEVMIAGSRRRQMAPLMTAENAPKAKLLEARMSFAPGTDTNSAAGKLLSACGAAGIVPQSFECTESAVSIVFKNDGSLSAQLLAADLEGLGCTVSPWDPKTKPLPRRPGAGLLCGLLGRTLSHTLSPAIHAHLAAYAYKCFEVEPERLDQFFSEIPFDGVNVTIPYKEAVIPYCARLTDRAKRVGAVNTLVRESDGTVTGDNTDYAGFSAMVEASGIDVKGLKALVLGSGGAAKCVRTVLEDMGAVPVIVSRSGPVTYENLNEQSDAAILVNCTPVGMYPRCGVSPVPNLADPKVLPNLKLVLDLIYNPSVTQLMMDARARGIPAMNGLLMLVVQAVVASEKFLKGTTPAVDIDSLFHTLEREAENIILIGMPGSGKSTVGRAIAEKLGRQFVDLDDSIEVAAGRAIPEIFRSDGEKAFRDLESKITHIEGARRGLVIATGGGTLLRPENRAALKQNGRLALITRPLDDLPVSGRPVSQSRSLASIWEERKAIYIGNADVAVENAGTPEDVADRILEAFGYTKGN